MYHGKTHAWVTSHQWWYSNCHLVSARSSVETHLCRGGQAITDKEIEGSRQTRMGSQNWMVVLFSASWAKTSSLCSGNCITGSYADYINPLFLIKPLPVSIYIIDDSLLCLLPWWWLPNDDCLSHHFFWIPHSINYSEEVLFLLPYLCTYISVDGWVSILFIGLQSNTLMIYSDNQTVIDLVSRRSFKLASECVVFVFVLSCPQQPLSIYSFSGTTICYLLILICLFYAHWPQLCNPRRLGSF